jgi:hypothetical protein
MLALEFVTDALRGIGVLSEIETPSAEQGSDAVRKLNELMASLAEDGIDLGFAPIADTSAAVDIPLGHVATIKMLLAVRCADLYGADVPEVVAGIASNGYNRLLARAVNEQVRSAQSNTLPVGQTNRYGRYNIITGY